MLVAVVVVLLACSGAPRAAAQGAGACEAAVADITSACLGGEWSGGCALEGGDEGCCAAVGEAVALGCDVGVAAAGVQWDQGCSFAPASFSELCQGCFVITEVTSASAVRCDGSAATLHQTAHAQVFCEESNMGEGLVMCAHNGGAQWSVDVLGAQQVASVAPPPPTWVGCSESSTFAAACGGFVRVGSSWVGLRARSLVLKSQGIESVPTELGLLTALTNLDLSGNRLSSLPPELGELRDLVVLTLYSNQIASIPSQLGNLGSLEVLDISNNQISSLPSQLGNLGSLKGFFCFNNQVSSLPSQLGNLGALQRLYFPDNQISSLPSELGDALGLEDLVLSNNTISSLPSQLGNLAHLAILSLSNNQLPSLPSELGTLGDLAILDLNNNRLSSLVSELGNIGNLAVLLASNNQISWIPPEIANVGSNGNRTQVQLSKNRIEMDILELHNLTSRASVNLVSNYVWGCDVALNKFSTAVLLNCMTDCVNAEFQRPSSACMELELTGQPPQFTNHTSALIGLREVRPGYRRSINDDAFSGWQWCLGRSESAAQECGVLAINSTSLFVETPEEGSYALTIQLVANFRDMDRCSTGLRLSPGMFECDQQTDGCWTLEFPSTSFQCDDDDVLGAEHAVQWTVDTTPPTAVVTIAKVLDGQQSTVRPGDVVAEFDGFVFSLRVSEEATLDTTKISVLGCNHSALVGMLGEDRSVEVTCRTARKGEDVTVVMNEGAFVDRAHNANAFANETVRTGCGVGKAFAGRGCQDCVDGETFADEAALTECKLCSTCGGRQAVLVPCAKSHDVVCQCTDGFEVSTEGRCEECKSKTWRARSVPLEGLEQCGLAELQTCQDCSQCSFPRVVEKRCDSTSNTKCSTVVVGLMPVFISACACVVVVALLCRLNHFSPTALVMLVLGALVGFADFVTDCYFIVYDAEGLLQAVSVAFLVIPVLVNVVVVLRLVNFATTQLKQRFNASKGAPTFQRSLQSQGKTFAIVFFACSINPRLLRPAFSDFLPQAHQPYNRQKYGRITQMLVWTEVAPTVFQDIPQLVVQLSFVVGNTPTFSATLSLAMTVLSILIEATAVALEIVTWRHNRRASSLVPFNAPTAQPDDEPSREEGTPSNQQDSLEMQKFVRGLEEGREVGLEEDDSAVQDKARALDEKEKALEAREAELGKKGKALKEKEGALDEKERALDAREAELGKKGKALKEKEGALEEVKRALEETKRELEARAAEFEAKKEEGALESKASVQ